MARTREAPAPSPADLTALARKHAATAIAALAEIATEGGSDAARVSAANALLDRGYGRTAQSVAEETPDDALDDAELACLTAEEISQLETIAEKIGAVGGQPR